MSSCRSCRAPIVWVETEARDGKPGRKMPLDAEPSAPRRARQVEGGNIMFTGATSGDGTPIVRYVPASAGMHVAHFVTCPNAKAHRKG